MKKGRPSACLHESIGDYLKAIPRYSLCDQVQDAVYTMAQEGYVGGESHPVEVAAIKFDYTYMGAIFGVIILFLVLLTNVEKYAPQYRAGMPEKSM